MGGGAQGEEGGVDDRFLTELLHSLPTRRLRLALVERLVAAKREVALIARLVPAARREEPPEEWLARQARLDERDELIRTYRCRSRGRQ